MLSAARVLVLVGALCIIALGLLAGGIGIVVSLLEPTEDRLTIITLSVSFLFLTVGMGSALAWHAWQSIQGQASGAFRPRRAWILGLLFLLIVFLGQSVLWLDLLPALTFPPIHVLAAILPPLTILGLVAYSLGSITRWRDAVFQLSSGAFLSTSLALVLEFAFILTLLMTAFLFVALQPGGLDRIQELAGQLQDPNFVQDPGNLAGLARSPIAIATVLLVIAGIVPLIEEAVKTIGVGLFSFRHPTRSQALLWGLSCGAGFALAEGVMNAAGGLDAWMLIVLARVGAALLHCFTGALMGLAWYAVVTDRRWGVGLGLYVGSVGIHGLWNALTAGMALLSMGASAADLSSADQALTGLAIMTIIGLLATLAAVAALGLAGLAWYVRTHPPVTVASEPLSGPPISSTDAILDATEERA